MEDIWKNKNIHWTWFCGDTAWRRADKDWARLSWSCASSQEAAGHSHGSSCSSCCMGQPWAGQSWEHCLVVSSDGLLLSFLLQQEGSAAEGGEGGCPGPLLCGGVQPLPRLPYTSTWDGLKYSPQMMHPLLITQNCNWKMSFSLHGMTQHNGLLSAEM